MKVTKKLFTLFLLATFIVPDTTNVLATSGPASSSTSFEVSSYCRAMCQLGQGGNLCTCSAAYFAGKRSAKDVLVPATDIAIIADSACRVRLDGSGSGGGGGSEVDADAESKVKNAGSQERRIHSLETKVVVSETFSFPRLGDEMFPVPHDTPSNQAAYAEVKKRRKGATV